jgi:hypothetical protein
MGETVLKNEIIDAILPDASLCGKIANELQVSVLSMPRIIKKKDKRLTQLGVIKIIREHYNYDKDSDLLEEMQEAEPKTTAA